MCGMTQHCDYFSRSRNCVLLLCYTEEEDQLRKALELSLRDFGKFESSVNNNLNHNTAAAAAAAAANDDDDDDEDVNLIDEAAVSRYMQFTASTASDNLLPRNAFGIIKDIRVNNIVASEMDKISEFDTKNFKQLTHGSDSSGSVTLLAGGNSGVIN